MNVKPCNMKRFLVLWLVLAVACSALSKRHLSVARIALLSDTHTMLRTNEHDGVYEQHFEKAIAQVNKANVDFVLDHRRPLERRKARAIARVS